MKKTILKFLILLSILVALGFYFSHKAEATSIYGQYEHFTSSRDGNASIGQIVGKTDGANILSSIDLFLTSSSTSEVIVQISCLTSSGGNPVNCSTGDSSNVPPLGRYLDSKPVLITTSAYYSFDFSNATSSPVELNFLKFWSLNVYYKTGTSYTANYLAWGSPDTGETSWPAGECSPVSRCGNITDLMFIVNDTLGQTYTDVFPGLGSLASTTTSTVPFTKADVEDACNSRFPTGEGLWNSIANGFCRLLVFISFPSTDSINYYKSQTGIIKTKFPFAYFYDVITAFDNVPISSTSTTPTLDIPIRGNNITFIDFGMIPSSTHDLVVGDGSLFYEIMQYSIWLAFGWFAFSRIKSTISP